MPKLEQLIDDLRAAVDPEKAVFLQRFFKSGPGEYAESDKFLGVVVPKQRTIARSYYKELSVDEAELLLKSEWHEERLTALFILVLKYQKGDEETKQQAFDVYVANTKHINNWDLVDSSAEYIIGPWLENNPYKMKVLSKMANSTWLWDRRIAMLATFHYIKSGKAEEALEIIKILLHDQHDLIQKAVGWMLREIGKRVDEDLLTGFLDKHASSMPRTALRYAIERLSPELRQHYLTLK